jgi:hypothetical protein
LMACSNGPLNCGSEIGFGHAGLGFGGFLFSFAGHHATILPEGIKITWASAVCLRRICRSADVVELS